ncbi:MAG: hypothetical protein KDA89_04025 [Planctomycetaceae bacterium]|nr:hypothetical protein [Planctomycetaceae bacterium]
MSGRDSWRGGRPSRRSAERREAELKSWQRSSRTTRAGRPGRKPWLRLLVVAGLLLSLVAFAITMFQPQPPLHTHFAVLNLLTDGGEQSGSSESFDPIAAPQFPEIHPDRRTMGMTTVSHSNTLAFIDSAADQISDAPVIVVWLQTQFVSDSSGNAACLVKSSTPDLSDRQSEPFSLLKDELTQLADQKKKIVLLVDESAGTVTDWRLGNFGSAAASQFLTWPEEEAFKGNLVVVVSHADGERSEPGTTGTGRESAFGRAVRQGLALTAGEEPGKKLDVRRFCEFLQTETAKWTQSHRNTSAQTVRVSPSPEKLTDGNFAILGAAAAPAEINDPATPEVITQLQTLWQKRGRLNERMAWRWNPLLWNAADELLLRSQEAALNGNSTAAQTLAVRAEATLNQLDSSVTEVISGDPAVQLNRQTGLPRNWFVGLPNADRLNILWEQAEPFSANDAPAEKVVRDNWNQYGFTAIGLKSDAAVRDSVLQLRTTAESAAARTMSIADIVRTTLLTIEQQTLETEDRLFINTATGNTAASPDTETTSGNNAPKPEDVSAYWEALQQFADAHQQAETTVQHTLSVSESLARWAAVFPFSETTDTRAQWRKLLAANLPNTVLTTDRIQQQSDQAGLLSLNVAPGTEQTAVGLRTAVYRLLMHHRQLSSLLHPEPPESGWSRDQLVSMTGDLSSAIDDCRREFQKVTETAAQLADKVCSPLSSVEELVLQYQHIRSTLLLTCLTAEERDRLVRSLVQADGALAKKEEPADSKSDRPAAAAASDDALWYLQHLNPLLDAAADAPFASGVKHTADLLATTNTADVSGALGDAVRRFWRDGRAAVAGALVATGTDARRQLRLADRLSRGFSAFDAGRISGNPTGRLMSSWLADFCQLHAERRLLGQWILPDEPVPWDENGWYAREAGIWIDAADKTAKSASAAAGQTSADFVTRQSRLRDQRSLSGRWEAIVVPKLRTLVDLSEDNQPEQDVAFSVTVAADRGSADGIAALALKPSAGQSFVTFPANGFPLPLSNPPASVQLTAKRLSRPESGSCRAVNFKTEVFFRGRRWSEPSERAVLSVDPCAAPEFVVERTARSATGSIRVSGDDVRPVAFVLDMSNSMEKVLPDGNKRIETALDALTAVVSRLRDDTRASLRVFGHRVKAIPNGNPREPNPNYLKEFRTNIPNGTEANKDVNLEVRQTTIDVSGRNLFLETIRKLRRVGPWGITPLLLGLRQAYDIDLNNQSGIVIAVTDGNATDPDETKPLERVLNQNRSTRLIVVAFDLNDAREREGLSQTLEKCNIDRSAVVNAGNLDELTRRIEAGLDPLTFSVLRQGTEQDAAELGKTVSSLPTGGGYSVRYAEVETEAGVPLTVGPGDLLDLRVNWSLRRFEFRRPKEFRRIVRAAGPANGDAPILLREVNSRITRTAGADNTDTGRLIIRLMLDHNNDFRPIRQPAEIEFRYSSSRGFRAPHISEQYLPDFGEDVGAAPGYLIEAAEWPLDQRVKVDAAWKMERTPPELVLTCTELNDRTSIPVSGRLPEAAVSTTLRNGVYEVRLDPTGPTAEPVDPDNSNAVEDIRVEIGSRGELQRNDSFVPDEVSVAIHRTQKGSVIYRFDGNYSADALTKKEIAFTSRPTRLDGAQRPETLEINPHDTVAQ